MAEAPAATASEPGPQRDKRSNPMLACNALNRMTELGGLPSAHDARVELGRRGSVWVHATMPRSLEV